MTMHRSHRVLRLTVAILFVTIFLGWAFWGWAFWGRLGSLRAEFAPSAPTFQKAVPVWAKGRDTEMNMTLGFRAIFDHTDGEKVELRLAGSSIYRVWVNGEFFAAGPARGPHGFYRVDVLDLTDRLKARQNVVAIEVVGYNANSYYLLDQPSFLQAEIVARAGGRSKVLAATGVTGSEVASATAPDVALMKATVLPERIQKVPRYSFQRTFMEAYQLKSGFDQWKTDPSASMEPVTLAVMPAKVLLARGVLYPTYTVDQPVQVVSRGQFDLRTGRFKFWKDRSLTQIGPELKGYIEEELEISPALELQKYDSVVGGTVEKKYDPNTPITLADKQWELLTMGGNQTGFLGATIRCDTPSEVWLLFDEIKSDVPYDVNCITRRATQLRVVLYRLEPGTYHVESIEPYTMQYVKLACMKGEVQVSDVYLREYAHPEVDAEVSFKCSDERINKIYDAAVQTYRQNALDIFMDCPSRERAGWLCDSYFTARTETVLTGQNRIERNFFENFLLPPTFKCLPEGMLPMCYPGDQYNGNFIPNWGLWFVLELKDYLHRGGDPQLVAKLEPKVMKLLDYFKEEENEDGLLESIKGWIFIEWSDANKYTRDVNYPTNMLYAAAIDIAGQIYDKPALCEKADKLRNEINRQSFDGEFFVDNAKRGKKSGKLNVTRNRTEVCQYYAFYFGVATPESHPKLWKRMIDEFGPDRIEKGIYPEIGKANSLNGNMLRMELLSQAGRSSQILREQTDYLLKMAEGTGTLWEHDKPSASTNHGFASHAAYTYFRDVLGLRKIDYANRRVTVRLADVPLDFCEGRVPTADGPISLGWKKSGKKVDYDLKIPDGWTAEVIKADGLE